jgi:hypothetical protein
MAETIHPDEAKTRPPDARLVFDEGDYDHALRCYYLARDWAVMSGQAFRQDVYGIINRPHHPRNPASERMVPEELINIDGWSLTVDLWCADDAALEWLRSLAVPEGSRLVEPESEE